MTEYLSQPRVIAMKIHNATAPGNWILPTSALEAFQAGARAYAGLAWLAAAPADMLLIADGTAYELLTCTSGRLTDQLDYLRAAHTRLNGLAPTAQLIAMTTNAGDNT